MKRFLIISLGCLFVLSVSASEIMARGGFRGGGGGGGFRGGGAAYGGFHGGGAAVRTPSMSRSSFDRVSTYQPSRPVSRQATPKQQIATRPATRPEVGTRPGGGLPGDRMSRPTQGQVQQFLHLPPGKGSDLAKLGGAAAAGALGAEGARRLLEGQRPGGLDRPAGERPGAGIRPGEPGRPSTLPERHVSNQIRDNLQHKYDHAFTPQWWKDHPNAARAHWDNHHHPWNHWWRAATWGAIAGWTAGAAASYGDPIYYDYGENVYYDGDDVYVSGSQVATAQQYYQQASDIATAAPEPTSTPEDDWLPLGVFALSQGNAADSNTVLQLSVNKQGAISGTYYNTTTDTARPIKGMVDKKSQRAAWTFADGKNTDIIMETGIYNLTQDQTEALVHFGKDKTQQWLMVRLHQPEDKQQADKKAQGS
ncbi:MAG: hypothetical protein HY913_21985 [Desulfomonile tiedjei]|nr:hypothetical protein [Desulfomonile tiedjei]